MPQEEDIKIVPPKAVQRAAAAETKRPKYIPWVAALIAVYFALVAMVAFVPLSGYMKVLSLILGTIILLDTHHSIKHHANNRD